MLYGILAPGNAPVRMASPIEFCKDHWHQAGNDLTSLILKILSGQQSLENFKFPDFVLIPMTSQPQSPNGFRPIGLCNTIYKIISKLLSERLTQVLPHMGISRKEISCYYSSNWAGNHSLDY